VLPEGDPELPWKLERLLFDQGYAVHVVQGAVHLEEAVRTVLAAGLIAIVPVSQVEERTVLDASIPSERVFAPTQAVLDADSAAEEIWTVLESSGRLGHQADPLTGGAGI
jgi:hypothetical protein